MNNYFISRDNFFKFLENLKSEYDVFVPVKSHDQRFYKKYESQTDDILVGEVRPFEPLKAFFTRAREVVAEDFKNEIPHSNDKPIAIVGVKACDLKGFKVQDFVFNDSELQDPFYIKNRTENLIISADCTCVIETCFCVALGIQPHPKDNFDLNLSEQDNGFLVEVGSEKGNDLVKKYSSLFDKPEQKQIKKREELRNKISSSAENNLKESGVPHQDNFQNIIETNYESDIWADEAKTCVECGACTIICPTCHCFLLYDQKDDEKMRRLRVWDSCMIKDYARVAGGANPRPKLFMRLRNRFEKKFDFFPKVANLYACTGCGRCISACPAKIDIRKVLKRLVENARNK